MDDPNFAPPPNRAIVTTLMLLASSMSTLDITIANVAMPHMAGAVSASEDEITWVLTSYIIASAIMTPMTGWLAARLGRKQLFLIAVTGFTAVSALCGVAQTLGQIVVFRVLQGLFGAIIPPLAQSVLLDSYPMSQRGRVMALWGMGVSATPVIGPLLGGWLTDAFNWRAVFFINVPIGVASAVGMALFMRRGRTAGKIPFDITGFVLLGVAIACLQLVLDRGGEKDWFQSKEIIVAASVAGVSVILYLVHTFAVDAPFIPLALFRDSNFVGATAFAVVNTTLTFASLAMLAPMTESTLGYSVFAAGVVMAPRGLGAFLSMFVVGWLIGRVDSRILILTGLGLFALAFDAMTHYSLQMDSSLLLSTGFVQGVGMGFMFIPTTTMAFVTLDPKLRVDGTGAFTLFRNMGGSCGISIMQAMFVRNVQIVHARLAEGVTPDNPLAHAPYLARPFSLSTPTGVAMLNGELTRQASMVAYIDIYRAMMWVSLCVAPAILLLRMRTHATTTSPPAPEETVLAFD